MSSIFNNNIWLKQKCYVTPQADFQHHHFDPYKVHMGTACLVAFSSDLFAQLSEALPTADEDFTWPYHTTPLKLCTTPGGKIFALHFPCYGSVRIANSLEQLKACGIKYVFGLGLGGALQQDIAIGDVILLEGAVRGDGVSRYYAPDEFPAVADLELTSKLRGDLEANHEKYHLGLSFGTDALYREEESLIGQLSELGVISIDLESSAFLTVGRRLGLKCAWVGVVSDRLAGAKHEGTIHSGHVMEALSRLCGYVVQIIDQSL